MAKSIIRTVRGQTARRSFLKGFGAASAGLVVAPAFLKGSRAFASISTGVFSLGVASGDPRAHSVVLWTRLAPDPLNGGGLTQKVIPVTWEVASDQLFANIVDSGEAKAKAVDGHAVHVMANNLPADSWFYYRFHALGETSRIGRTRTFPQPGAAVSGMRFALVSCQNYTDGFFPAYRDLAQQDLDFVVHVGDYIYEHGAVGSPIDPSRNHTGGEIFSVTDYRNRYALYRLDQNLQDAQAMFPFIVTPDDHEVDNNYAGLTAEEGAPYQGADFAQRRANAYQVYSESMPLRAGNQLHGSRMTLYREFKFGKLANMFVLDTRQFRTDQPAQDGFGSTDPDSVAVEPVFMEKLYDPNIDNPNATMMGPEQEAWLASGLQKSRSQWNIIAQQVMLMPWNLITTAKAQIQGTALPPQQKAAILAALGQVDNFFQVDAWDGYRAARTRLLQMLGAARPNNPIVLSGDIHSAWAANLLTDFSNPSSDMVAAEFTCTSIASTFLAIDPRPTDFIVRLGVKADNPHVEFFNALFRGYCICDVNPQRWQTTYRGVGTLADVANTSDPLALVPRETSTVETDAVMEIQSGFTAPGSAKRVETISARVPMG